MGSLVSHKLFNWSPDRALLFLDKGLDALYDCSNPIFDIIQQTEPDSATAP